MSNKDIDSVVAEIMSVLTSNGNFGIDYMEQKTFEEIYGASEFVVVMPDDREGYE